MDIEDIFEDDGKKKPIKSGQKGKRVEREIVKILNQRFATILQQNNWGEFSRSVGSGNRWGQQVVLSKEAASTYSGDITVPVKFRFILESKGGYSEIDLCNAFENGCRKLDEFLKQVCDDHDRLKKLGVHRDPMLLWKKDRKPRLAFLRSTEFAPRPGGFQNILDYSMKYREWTVVAFEKLLQLEDNFFFNVK